MSFRPRSQYKPNALLYLKDLEIGELQPTRATLQMADRSIRYPEGFVEDVLIQVGEFVFPVDFTVLTMEAVDTAARKRQFLIILGRPFLNTVNALINCRSG